MLKMQAMKTDGTETLLLYCSLQYLAKRGWFCVAVLQCHARGLLRLVVVDEAHIHAMHGRSFRQAIHVLADTLFVFLFGVNAVVLPLFLTMTATMPNKLLVAFSVLTHVDCCSTDHQIWASAEEFQQ